MTTKRASREIRPRGVSGERVTRYAGDELREATAREVRQRVAAKLRRDLSVPDAERMLEADIRQIVGRVGSAAYWKALDRARKALVAARTAKSEMTTTTLAADEPAHKRLAEIVATADKLVALIEGLGSPIHHKSSPRSIIADPLIFDRTDFWWKNTGPTLTDRALISLLAGHFPSVGRKVRMTVAEVIEKEAHTIGRNMGRHGRGPVPSP